MSFAFERRKGLILVRAEIAGPLGSMEFSLALDTGATTTFVNQGPLRAIGCNPDDSTQFAGVSTVSGMEQVPIVELPKLRALGVERSAMRVVCHNLPEATGVDGLLGLDFFRGRVLMIDFVNGQLSLS